MPSVRLKSPFRDQESTLWGHLAIPWTRRTNKVSDTFAFEAKVLLFALFSQASHPAAPPRHSVLQPPKQAPSVWQIFFTDWLQEQKLSAVEGKKLNVAQEAKEAGHVYNELSEEERNVRPMTPRPSEVRIYQGALFRHCNSERLLLRKSTSANLLHGSVRSPPRILNARTHSGRGSASLESRGGRILMIQMLPRGR